MSVIKVHDRFFEPFIFAHVITERIEQMVREISAHYEEKNPVFLVVLNGAFIFAADLIRQINIQSEVSFVKISSYMGTQSTEEVKELIGFTENLTNRNVVIIEDIIDTGLSMRHILKQVAVLQPASVKVVTLLLKREALKYPIYPEYVGFEIASQFVLGYGMDYDGYGRNLPHIYIEKQQ